MNFISRNLWWILLFLFFLFMLFIISTNQNKEINDELTLSWSTASGQVDTSEILSQEQGQNELEKLVEKITEEEFISEEVDVDNGISEDTSNSSGAILGPKKSIFDIFKRNNKDEESATGTGIINSQDENSDEEDVMDEEDIVDSEETKVSEDAVEVSTEIVSPWVQVVENSGQGLTKTTGTSKALAATPLYFSPTSYTTTQTHTKLPGIHLDTEIGKKFQVGVQALKLNDKTFTHKLAYMSRGDVLKQLTWENRFGCFQIEILSASTPSNIGKKWYVCKKYLSDIQENTMIVESWNAADKEISTLQEKIYLKTLDSSVILMNQDSSETSVTLDMTDILLQISPIHEYGRMIEVKIVGSNTLEKNGVVGYVLSSQVETHRLSE